MAISKRQIILRCVFTVTTVLIISFIFFQSMKNAEQSSAQSGRVLAFLNSITSFIGLGTPFTHTFVRTCAHFTEFAVLGISLYSMFNAYSVKPAMNILLSALAFTLFAVSDECIQLFSNGRTFQFFDICIDVAGAFVGCAVALLLILMLNKCKNQKSK